MNTNYDKINSFEAASVILAFVGILVVGVILIASLTPRQQGVVLTSFNLFDLHEFVAESTQTVQSILDVPNEFYNQFYVAFTQVAVLPAEIFTIPEQAMARAYEGLGNYSDQIASVYQTQNQAGGRMAYAGQVLGVMIEMSNNSPVATEDFVANCFGQKSKQAQSLVMPYEFVPPDLNKIKLIVQEFINPVRSFNF